MSATDMQSMPPTFMPHIEATCDKDTKNILFHAKHEAYGKKIELGFVHTRIAQYDSRAIPLYELRMAVWKAAECARLGMDTGVAA